MGRHAESLGRGRGEETGLAVAVTACPTAVKASTSRKRAAAPGSRQPPSSGC